MQIKLSVNGNDVELDVAPGTPLIYALRNQLGLTGAKVGCGLEQCGACAVLVDGKATLSCVAEAASFDGASIRTIEGLGDGGLTAVQRAFITHRAAQCGYCTPGMIVAVTELYEATQNGRQTTDEDIRAALEQHLCRCGSQGRILAAASAAIGQANSERGE